MYTSPSNKCSLHQGQPECESCGQSREPKPELPFLWQNFNYYAFIQHLHASFFKEKMDLSKRKCIEGCIQNGIQGLMVSSEVHGEATDIQGQEQQYALWA